MAQPGQAGVGKIYTMSRCNECKSNHTENYSRCIKVQCYQYNEIGHYARNYLEKVLIEQMMQGSSASHTMRGSGPPKPNRVGVVKNKASADVGLSQKEPVGQESSVVGNDQQARGFVATK